jgi:hypothetical protein
VAAAGRRLEQQAPNAGAGHVRIAHRAERPYCAVALAWHSFAWWSAAPGTLWPELTMTGGAMTLDDTRG